MKNSLVSCPNQECSACQIRASSLFASLGDSALRRLDRHKFARAHARGEILFHEGTPSATVCCVHAGVAKVFRTAPHGRSYVLRLAGPGEVLGLEAALSGQPHGDTAQMVSDGAVCHFDAPVLKELFDDEPGVRNAILEALATAVMEANSDRAELAAGDVRERTALVLLELCNRWGTSSEEGNGAMKINLRLTRQDLAGLVGATTETVIRQLADLRQRGILALHGRELVILDSVRLARIAHVH